MDCILVISTKRFANIFGYEFYTLVFKIVFDLSHSPVVCTETIKDINKIEKVKDV